MQLAEEIGFLTGAAFHPRCAGVPRSVSQALARLGVRRFRPSALQWMAAAVGFYLLCSFAYAVLIGQPHQENIAKAFGAVPAVQVLLIVVAAPVSEEICFRGMLFGGLREAPAADSPRR